MLTVQDLHTELLFGEPGIIVIPIIDGAIITTQDDMNTIHIDIVTHIVMLLGMNIPTAINITLFL